MPANLGTKHSCFKCGAKFYDLKKSQVVCPKCGANQRDAPVQKPAPPEKRAKVAVPEPAQDVEDASDEADEAFEELDEDVADDDEP